MKKENEKKINEVDLENVSGGYKTKLDIALKGRQGSQHGYTRTTELSLGEALRLNYEGQMGQPDVEEKLKGFGFERESTDVTRSNLSYTGTLY